MENEMENREERAERFARIWWQSRMDAKKSQEYMALSMGVSKRTIQNWERGVTAPDMLQSIEWFQVLGLNPNHYFMYFFYPYLQVVKDNEEEERALEKSLAFCISNMSVAEKKQMLYLMTGNHGSSWYSLLQMFTAHAHTSMRSRVAAARIIAENYEMEDSTGNLVCPEEAPPDMEVLNRAISQGKQAAQDGKSGYMN